MTGFMGRDSVYIVAELGSNHGGSLDAALALIDAATNAGADAAKLQAGHADHVYDPAQFPDAHAPFRKYVEPVLDWLPQLAARCEERGIDFGCSTFCFDALDAVDPFVKWHKVASIEATWTEYVQAVRAKRKWTLISTGLMDAEELKRVNNTTIIQDFALAGYGEGTPGIPMPLFMNCAVSYPLAIEDADVRAMWSFPTPPGTWGLSDHTIHPTIAPCAAVALGACVIEKHIRLWEQNRDQTFAATQLADHGTPDYRHSIDPWQFREMVDAIRLTEKALGSSEKRIRESEKPYLKYRRGPKGLRGA